MSSIIIEKEKSFYVTTQLANPTILPDGSKLGSDGTVVSADGSTAFINLNQGIEIPIGVVECNIRVENANIWYTTANISAELENNTFDYIYSNVQQPQIIIPDGLYSIETLNAFLSRQFVNRGQLENLIVLTGDESTQKVVITLQKYAQVDLTPYNSIRSVIGWTSQVFPVTMPVIEVSGTGQNIAKFNNIQNFTIRSDIVIDGLSINNVKSNLMAVISIPQGSANSQITYQPFRPSIIEIDSARGKKINNFYVSICDQNGNLTRQSEPWTALLVLSYKVLYTNQDVGIINL